MIMDANDMALFIAEGQEYYALDGLTVAAVVLENPIVRDNAVTHSAWSSAHKESSPRRLRVVAQGLVHDGYADILLQRCILAGEHCMMRMVLQHGDSMEAMMRITQYESNYEQDDVARYQLRFENAGEVVFVPSS